MEGKWRCGSGELIQPNQMSVSDLGQGRAFCAGLLIRRAPVVIWGVSRREVSSVFHVFLPPIPPFENHAGSMPFIGWDQGERSSSDTWPSDSTYTVHSGISRLSLSPWPGPLKWHSGAGTSPPPFHHLNTPGRSAISNLQTAAIHDYAFISRAPGRAQEPTASGCLFR